MFSSLLLESFDEEGDETRSCKTVLDCGTTDLMLKLAAVSFMDVKVVANAWASSSLDRWTDLGGVPPKQSKRGGADSARTGISGSNNAVIINIGTN